VRIFIRFEANKTVFIRFIRIKANLHVLQGKRIEKKGKQIFASKRMFILFSTNLSFWGEI
jgi:hypothetical protein